MNKKDIKKRKGNVMSKTLTEMAANPNKIKTRTAIVEVIT